MPQKDTKMMFLFVSRKQNSSVQVASPCHDALRSREPYMILICIRLRRFLPCFDRGLCPSSTFRFAITLRVNKMLKKQRSTY